MVVVQLKKIFRKERLSPSAAPGTFQKFSPETSCQKSKKALLLPLSAGLTVEAAVVVPLFAAAMAAVLQFVNVYTDAARIGSALAQTGEEMSIGAYASEYTDSDSPVPLVLSAAYAEGRVRQSAGTLEHVRNQSMLLSGFLTKDQQIDLVMTYQVKSPSGLIRIPGIVFLQRAIVRGWVGRGGSGSVDQEDPDSQEEPETVYVTQYGSVYHTDPDCSHIHLSIHEVSSREAMAARNVYGEKYHACEKCGGGGDRVYITSDGNRYHSSLECSGLKRSVQEMHIDEIGSLRPCSKCAGG